MSEGGCRLFTSVVTTAACTQKQKEKKLCKSCWVAILHGLRGFGRGSRVCAISRAHMEPPGGEQTGYGDQRLLLCCLGLCQAVL